VDDAAEGGNGQILSEGKPGRAGGEAHKVVNGRAGNPEEQEPSPAAEAAVDEQVQTGSATISREPLDGLPCHVARGQKADTATDDVADQRVEKATREPEERARCRFERNPAERCDDGR
jgi:hypothetical protein